VVNVVFFGTPEFAVPSLQAILQSGRHTVVAVVTQPDRPRGRRQRVQDPPVKAAALACAPVLQPERIRTPAFVAELRSFEPDLGVVAAYGRILPDDVLGVPRLGMINVHASLLPKYRGAAPVHRAVMNGERETGVTIMRVVHALDAGAMFAKAATPIGPDETSDVVERRLSELGARLLVEVMDQIAAGTAHEEPQDDSQATYAAKMTKEEGAIDWTRAARDIHNRVRGLHPWPHASTLIAGERTLVLRSHVLDAPGVADPKTGDHARLNAAPGTVVHVTHDAIHVATGRGTLSLDQLKPEGRRSMTAREFLAGHPVSVGMVFGAP
jgi:methionyl-tRNA formyltransferase